MAFREEKFVKICANLFYILSSWNVVIIMIKIKVAVLKQDKCE